MSESFSANLLNSRFNHTSQFGEDGILKAIFNAIQPQTKWCVECGAHDGRDMSNTLLLREGEGWSGVMIEGSAEGFRALQTACTDVARHWLVPEMVTEENTMDKILSRTPIPVNFDLLSLDIDGNEYCIWSQISRYRARVVVVEFNPSFGADVFFVQNPKANAIGSSLQSIARLGSFLGYTLVCVTDVNCIFVDSPEVVALNLAPKTPQELFWERWSNGDCPWMPRTVSDYNGNHYIIRAGGWNGGQLKQLLPGTELDTLRDRSEQLQGPILAK